MRRRFRNVLIPAILLMLISTAHPGIHKKHVLYISSYNPSFPTFFQQVDGIRSVFKDTGVILDIEFMDTKRFPEKNAGTLFHSQLSARIKSLPRYDAVIVADDAAFRYAVQQKDRLFRDIPVFFCGINDVPFALSFEKGDRMRGAIEAVSMGDTLALARKIFPGRKKLAVITDGTKPGQADLRTFENEPGKFNFEVKVMSLADMSFDELHASLEKLGDDWTALLLSCYMDRTGEVRLFDEEFEGIMKHSKIPVFHLWEHGLGEGIFGGRVISHYEQGRSAALMVRDLFSGVPMKDIRILRESPNAYMFDNNQLKRFKVSTWALPQGSIIINSPHSIIEAHPQYFLAGALSIFFLTIIIFIQLRRRNILKREVAAKTADLVKSNDRLQTSLENAKQFLWDWDLVTDDFLLVKGSDETGDKHINITVTKGQEWYERLDPDYRENAYNNLQSHLNGEAPEYEASYRIKKDDGSYAWMISRGWITGRDPGRKPLKMSGISMDISTLREIEEEISSSRNMLQAVLDTIPMGVFWKNLDLVYTGCNGPFARSAMLRSPEDIAGKRDSDLVWRDKAELHEVIDREVIATGRRKGFYEEEMVTESGETVYYRKMKSPLTDINGRVIGILGIQEDITVPRRMREQRVRMQKLESVGILAGGMAHDFNNMLMGISGALSVLRLNENDEKKLHWIGLAEKSCSAAVDVTSRLITFARGGDPVMKKVEISSLVQNAAGMDDFTAAAHVRFEISGEMPGIMADERQLGQVMRNLMENAREATSSGGEITVSYGMADPGTAIAAGLKAGRYVRISVNDTGRGIPAENIGKVFDPYFSTKEMGSQKGQGLGLAVCHSIVKNHGGAITAESDPQNGTTFTIYLPAV